MVIISHRQLCSRVYFGESFEFLAERDLDTIKSYHITSLAVKQCSASSTAPFQRKRTKVLPEKGIKSCGFEFYDLFPVCSIYVHTNFKYENQVHTYKLSLILIRFFFLIF